MEASCSQVKMASLEIQLESGTNSRPNPNACNLGGYGIGANPNEGERNAISDDEDVDIEMYFCYNGGLSDDNECMWLSSGGASTSFLSPDDLHSLDILEIDFCDTLYQSSTMLSVSRGRSLFLDVDNQSSIVDDSTKDSIQASSVLVTMQNDVGKDTNESTIWQSTSGGNNINNSFNGSSEAIEFAQGRSHCDDLSTNASGSWTSLSTDNKPSSAQGHDFDRTSSWVSLLDLEGEESEWDKDGSDSLGPDFPSPSYRILRNIKIRSSKLSFCPSSRQLSPLGSPSSIFDLSPKHVFDVESPPRNSDADGPLFWPFDWKSYWRPEFEGNYLGISPRASILKIKRPIGHHTPKAVQLRLHKRNAPSNIQQEYRGKILIRSRSMGPTLADQKTRDQVSHSGKTPSTLSKPTRATRLPSDKSAGNPSKKGGKGHGRLNSVKRKRGRDQNSSLSQYLLESEAGEFQIYLEGGIAIEALVGLDEFDGHEGIGKMMRTS